MRKIENIYKLQKYKKGKFENGQKLNKIIFFKLKILKNWKIANNLKKIKIGKW